MTPTAAQIAAIYDGVERLPLHQDLQGWNSTTPIFERLITCRCASDRAAR